MIEFNGDSNHHLSALLFGGTLTEPVKETIGIIKTGPNKGKEKTRVVKTPIRIKGLELKPLDEWMTKKEGVYKSNEEVLSYIAEGKVEAPEDAKAICEAILKIRQLQKELSTYYDSTSELVYDLDSCVHPNFVHVKTETGRLSHRLPNVGNQPKPPSNAMKHFISRYTNGSIVSADYGQLELVVQAQLSTDGVYMNDVIQGIDFHCKRLAMKEDIEYAEVVEKCSSDSLWKAKRTQIKQFSFQRAYGAGASSISQKTGIDKQEIEGLIKREAEEYPDLTQWQKDLKREVESTGQYQSITGRLYKFKKYPAPQWLIEKGVYDNYSPNEILNYMVQGTGTADIVLIMIGQFWRHKAIYNRDKYLMINTVHDSLLLDCKEEYKEQAKKDLEVLTQWKELCYNRFKYKWHVPLAIEVSEGDTWYDCF